MKLLKNIVLAIDFSSSSTYVVDNAIHMAKTFQAEITPIYVLPDDIQNEKARTLLKDFSLSQLDLIKERIKEEGVAVSSPVLAYGNFSDKIIETADEIQANMIMIGAGEELEKQKVFKLGSNAEKIIKQSSKPVFVVKNQKEFGIKKIFCPVDFSAQSKLALENAVTMARRFKSQLVIFSAYDVSYLSSIQTKINLEKQVGFIKQDHQKKFHAFLRSINLAGLDAKIETKQGAPAVEISKSIKKHKADLLVIGTTGKSGLSKILMGSVTEKVIRKIANSFITIKKEPIIQLDLESKIHSIENHYKTGQQLYDDGFFEEAIDEFKACLSISFMHVPSLKALSKVYKTLGDSTSENLYREMTREVLDKMYNHER